MSEMYFFQVGKQKGKEKMEARLENGRCTNYSGNRLWQVDMQPCVWDSTLKYPSPACLHMLCCVLIILTSQQLPVCLGRQLLTEYALGTEKGKVFHVVFTAFGPH